MIVVYRFLGDLVADDDDNGLRRFYLFRAKGGGWDLYDSFTCASVWRRTVRACRVELARLRLEERAETGPTELEEHCARLLAHDQPELAG